MTCSGFLCYSLSTCSTAAPRFRVPSRYCTSSSLSTPRFPTRAGVRRLLTPRTACACFGAPAVLTPAPISLGQHEGRPSPCVHPRHALLDVVLNACTDGARPSSRAPVPHRSEPASPPLRTVPLCHRSPPLPAFRRCASAKFRGRCPSPSGCPCYSPAHAAAALLTRFCPCRWIWSFRPPRTTRVCSYRTARDFPLFSSPPQAIAQWVALRGVRPASRSPAACR